MTSKKVRDPDTYSAFLVFGYDSDEDQEALCDEEDTKDEMIEPSLHGDDETQKYGERRWTISDPWRY